MEGMSEEFLENLEGLLIRDLHSVLPSLKSWSIIEICKVEIIKCSLISQKDEGT